MTPGTKCSGTGREIWKKKKSYHMYGYWSCHCWQGGPHSAQISEKYKTGVTGLCPQGLKTIFIGMNFPAHKQMGASWANYWPWGSFTAECWKTSRRQMSWQLGSWGRPECQQNSSLGSGCWAKRVLCMPECVCMCVRAHQHIGKQNGTYLNLELLIFSSCPVLH